jgi:hypothetical protein
VLGTTLAVLGLVGTAATVFFLTGVTEYLGVGGTERVAAYVIPVGLAVAGTALWRLAGPGSSDRQAERAAARRAQAERARERDAALEPAAGRDASTAAAHDADPDDHWAPVERRRR